MKKWKILTLIFVLISVYLTFIFTFNFDYWGEMAPIYAKGLIGKLPKESDGLKLPDLPNPFVNNQSILGLDEDKNGIRDDVDYWIAVNGINYNERMAIREKMKVEQKLLYFAEKEDFDGFQNATRELWIADACQTYISRAYHKNRERSLLKMIGGKFLYNTNNREKAMKRISMFGYIYEAPEGTEYVDIGNSYQYCTFKIRDLPSLIKDKERATFLKRKEQNFRK